MNKDELLDLLDLSGPGPPPDPAAPPVVAAAGAAPQAAGPTALALDDWALRKGAELLAESDRLKATGLDAFAAADFHAAAFLPDPDLLPACADPARHAFLAQLLETPEYWALHAATQLRDAAAAIAATAFAEEFAAAKEKATAGAAGAAPEVATLKAVGAAVLAARKEVGEADEAAAALGLGPGAPGSNNPAAVAALFKRVRGDAALRRICDLAGRFRRVAQSKQRQKATHGVDDVVGVTSGGDVGALLPVELARLAVPGLELDTLRRLAERQCQCREYRATEPVGKGPIIVCVDESGSMQGEKAHTAKALALALAWVARRQGRWAALVAYSGNSGERLLALPPGRWDEAALCDWLTAFIGRGSTLDVPVRELPDYYERLRAPRGKTDVVFVTDAACRIPEDVRDRFLAWKKEVTARLISLVVGADPGDLAGVSDECHRVNALAADGEAVGRTLSL